MQTIHDTSGRSGSIMDLGGGIKSYSDNRSAGGTIIEFGSGTQPAYGTLPPPTPSRRAQTGFDEKYQRDYNIFNPANQYRPDNPLNPAQTYTPNNPFNPANRYDPGNPVNPANQYNPNNPFNPANQYNPQNPLNPANRFNPNTPFEPLNRPPTGTR